MPGAIDTEYGGGGREGACKQFKVTERTAILAQLLEIKSGDPNSEFWVKLASQVRQLNLGLQDVKHIMKVKCSISHIDKAQALLCPLPLSYLDFWRLFQVINIRHRTM